jgi:hypothetical protein
MSAGRFKVLLVTSPVCINIELQYWKSQSCVAVLERYRITRLTAFHSRSIGWHTWWHRIPTAAVISVLDSVAIYRGYPVTGQNVALFFTTGQTWCFRECSSCFGIFHVVRAKVPGGAVGWGTVLQTERSRVRFPMESLEFFSEFFRSHCGPGVHSACNRNEHQDLSWG